MIPDYKIEFCTASIDDAIEKASLVYQIELCSHLEEGGLTPDLGDALRLKAAIDLPIKIMIRHRAGDFVYTTEELDIMIRQANDFINNGFSRFVFGCSHQDGRLHIDQINHFCKSVFPSKVCIHKAIDESPNILADLQLLLNIKNINEVLTSGGKSTAIEGIEMLNNMVELSQNKLEIIAAGSIRSHNLDAHRAIIHASIFHGRLIV